MKSLSCPNLKCPVSKDVGTENIIATASTAPTPGVAAARLRGLSETDLELFRCYFNFVRPHKALKFGGEVRTPAIQAGLTTRQLTLKEIFPSAMFSLVVGESQVRTMDCLGRCGRDADASCSIALDDGSTAWTTLRYSAHRVPEESKCKPIITEKPKSSLRGDEIGSNYIAPTE
jgi:hypothetical protein